MTRTHDEPPSRLMGRPKLERMPRADLPESLTKGAQDVWHWESETYYGCLLAFPKGCPLAPHLPYYLLSISSIDETARHDFRDFQQLKNHLCGEEWEGLELYPAESRLVDPSNRYYLWVFPRGIVKWGLPAGRRVRCVPGGPPQRPFPETVR